MLQSMVNLALYNKQKTKQTKNDINKTNCMRELTVISVKNFFFQVIEKLN